MGDDTASYEGDVKLDGTMMSAFKIKEKLFKACANVHEAVARGGALDLQHLVDESPGLVRKHLELWGRSIVEFSFLDYPGVHVLCDSVGRRQQVELTYHSLRNSLSPPNTTNLHAHWDSSRLAELDAIWETDGPLLDPTSTIADDASTSVSALRLPRSCVLSRVRWATLGYQYNWTDRSYDRDRHVPFSLQLATAASQLASATSSAFSMCAVEAGIINFYPEGQVMGGHCDDGEEALDSPVVSVSLGSPCIFLLGGLDKSAEPLPLVLRSGDVLVLGGQSRLRVHGVPRVWVAAEGCPAALHPSTAGAEKVHHCGCTLFLAPPSGGLEQDCCTCGGVEVGEIARALRFLSWARVNINLRQVFRSETNQSWNQGLGLGNTATSDRK